MVEILTFLLCFYLIFIAYVGTTGALVKQNGITNPTDS